MLGVTDPVTALDLDVAAAGRLLLHDSGAVREREVVFGEPDRARGTRVSLDEI